MDMKKQKSFPATRRLGISIAAWIACLPALYFHLLLVTVAIPTLKYSGTDATGDLRAIALVFGAIAWLILALMNIAWLSDRRLGKPMPFFGTVFAGFGLAPFASWGSTGLWALLPAVPGFIFAIYMVRWHTEMVKPNRS